MSEPEVDHIYPGVDRWQYFVAKMAMVLLIIFVIMIAGPASPVARVMGPVMMVGTMFLDVLRLRNIGVTQWYAFVRFLPFGNTILDICLTSAQSGWAETRQLDRTGKRILIVQLLLLAVMLIMFWRTRTELPFWV